MHTTVHLNTILVWFMQAAQQRHHEDLEVTEPRQAT